MERKEELMGINCPMGVTQKIIGGKWKLLIIWKLKDGVSRFSELQRSLGNITQSALTQQLRELETDGLIHREVYKVVPPKVEYSLTEIGKNFLSVVDKMSEWGIEYLKYLKN